MCVKVLGIVCEEERIRVGVFKEGFVEWNVLYYYKWLRGDKRVLRLNWKMF